MLVSALVTPFRAGDGAPDLPAAASFARFQLAHGCDAVLLFGIAGEGSALHDDERERLLDAVLGVARPEQVMVALGEGTLSTVLARARQACSRGVRNLLLTDAPYSGASSSALRTQWHEPVARALPESRLFPCAVPSRTGTELLPDDLARLAEDCPNVVGVKDATGRLARMGRVRELCGEHFAILCGDDLMLRDALLDPHIRADGAVASTTNLAPAAMRALYDAARAGRAAAARELHDALSLLFGLASITTEEDLPVRGERRTVPQRSRNPVPLKAALSQLGACDAGVRAPLGPIGARGAERVSSALALTARRYPEWFVPLQQALVAADAAPHVAGTGLASDGQASAREAVASGVGNRAAAALDRRATGTSSGELAGSC